MHGRRLPSFLATKKPAATGEEDGRMMPQRRTYASSPSQGLTDYTVAPRVEGPLEGDRWHNHKDGEVGAIVHNLY